MALIHVDNRPFEVNSQHNLLQACLSLGLDLPYFCWHPVMGSVGACRQCAVKQFKDENDSQGKIVMACMSPAADGTRISIDDPETRDFRAGIIEWMMVNHPHDCPVCEEGGECHLQDMTQLSGHVYRRYRFSKRTFPNQYLGPFINHEMNRCITCYRCVRFYRDYAGGSDLQALASHDHVYFGRHQDGVLENEFSGNLVEVCPTGVFTDKTLGRHYVRKWDLQSAPSLCQHCSLGCNTSPGERYGRLRRIVNRYHGEINGYFLCDRGRFGYDFVNSEERLRRPWEGSTDIHKTVTPEQALDSLKDWFGPDKTVLGIGSPRASLETNFALRTLVGAEWFHSGMTAREQRLVETIHSILTQGPARTPSLSEAEQADAVLVLGEDVTQTAPRLALTLRQTVRNRAFAIATQLKIPLWQDAAVRNAGQQERNPLFILSPRATRLDDIAAGTWQGAPDDLARLGFAIAHALNDTAPAVTDLAPQLREQAEQIARALQATRRPLIVSGTGCGSEAVIQAAANVAWALCVGERKADLCYALPECNSLGLSLMDGGHLEAALETILNGRVDTLVVAENDLFRRLDRNSVEAALDKVSRLVVIDHSQQDTVRRADGVLPAATFAEAQGSLVNNEGRAQRFFPVFLPKDEAIRPSWRWLQTLGAAAGRPLPWQSLDQLTRACGETFPLLRPLTAAAPTAEFRLKGQKIPRQPSPYSGRTAMHANETIHEPQAHQDPDSPLAYSMEGYSGQPPAALLPTAWAPHWNSNEAINKFQQEIDGPLRGGDPGIRLIEPPELPQTGFFTTIPEAFMPRKGAWLVVPFHHIFGSEELSARAAAVDERIPAPYLALNPDDAESLGVADGTTVQLLLNGQQLSLPVTLDTSLRPGLAGLPIGLRGLAGITELPTWAKVIKGNHHE